MILFYKNSRLEGHIRAFTPKDKEKSAKTSVRRYMYGKNVGVRAAINGGYQTKAE